MKQVYLREGRSGGQDTFSLLFLLMIGNAIFEGEAAFFEFPGNGVWITCILSFLFAIAVFYITSQIRKMGEGDLLNGMYSCCGKKAGKAAAFLVLAGLLMNVQRIIGTMGVLVYQDIIPEMSVDRGILLILLGILPLAFMGLECITRTAKFFIFLAAAMVAIVLISNLQEVRIYKLAPYFEDGIGHNLLGGAAQTRIFYSSVCTGFLSGSLNGENFDKTLKKSFFVCMPLIFLILFLTAASFSTAIKAENYLPVYNVFTVFKNTVSGYRIETTVILLWILCALIIGAAGVYVISNVFSRMFEISDIRPVVTGVWSILLCVTLLLYRSDRGYGLYLEFSDIWLFAFLLIPFFSVYIAGIMKRRRKRKI